MTAPLGPLPQDTKFGHAEQCKLTVLSAAGCATGLKSNSSSSMEAGTLHDRVVARSRSFGNGRVACAADKISTYTATDADACQPPAFAVRAAHDGAHGLLTTNVKS